MGVCLTILREMNGAIPKLWAWLAIGAAFLALLYLLSPILAPFLAGAIFAYILNPLVGRIAGRRISRTVAVVLVLLLCLLALVALLLVVLPLLAKELRLMAERLPAFLDWLNRVAAPWLAQHLGRELQFDLGTLKQLAGEALQNNQDLLPRLLGSARIGGMALLGIAVNVLLIPVVLFFLLRDWRGIVARAEHLIPRPQIDRARAMLAEIDAVLAEFLRGQVLVMLVMSAFYVGALWLAGLEFALPIGLITGMLVFIPYLGAITGVVLGTIAALLQFGTLPEIAWVWLAFAAGQALEGMLVTPWLVGDRIGLHPVAVIFALLAFGQVFGLFGILLALPASAALLVALRHLRRAYLESALYTGKP
ncbi:MAG: AI-2E family transporter [Betaproteobacteria bacterium]|nr:AI-2E family transporter [Betaproteobacteria bacterium]